MARRHERRRIEIQPQRSRLNGIEQRFERRGRLIRRSQCDSHADVVAQLGQVIQNFHIGGELLRVGLGDAARPQGENRGSQLPAELHRGFDGAQPVFQMLRIVQCPPQRKGDRRQMQPLFGQPLLELSASALAKVHRPNLVADVKLHSRGSAVDGQLQRVEQ